jgi:hypothetical protein
VARTPPRLRGPRVHFVWQRTKPPPQRRRTTVEGRSVTVSQYVSTSQDYWRAGLSKFFPVPPENSYRYILAALSTVIMEQLARVGGQRSWRRMRPSHCSDVPRAPGRVEVVERDQAPLDVGARPRYAGPYRPGTAPYGPSDTCPVTRSIALGCLIDGCLRSVARFHHEPQHRLMGSRVNSV